VRAPKVLRPLTAMVGSGVLLAFWLGASAARADDAGALFDRGLADMQGHKYDTACPALAESYRLDPHAGGLFTLAECENEWGKTASAMADYDRFLDLVSHLAPKDRARQAERAKVAAEKRAALSRDVPSITLSLDRAVPQGSTVKIDGKAVAATSLGSAIPEDPGDHVVLLQTIDGRKNEQRVTLAKGDARAVTLVLPVVEAAAAPVAVETPAPAPASSGSTRRTVMIVTAGVGAAAIVAGAVLGAIVVADKSSIDANCPTATTCANGADAGSANGAVTLGWASTGAFIGGGAALGAAAVLFFTRPKSASIEPVVAPSATGATFGLRGAF
jgi:hypothetical protein